MSYSPTGGRPTATSSSCPAPTRYWRRKREQWQLLAEGASDDATADYLHQYSNPPPAPSTAWRTHWPVSACSTRPSPWTWASPRTTSTASGPPPSAHDLVEAAEDSGDPLDERHDDTAVDPVPSVPVRCLTVESPSRLYCVGNTYIPTHNTVCLVGIVAEVTCRGWPVWLGDPKRVEFIGLRDWPLEEVVAAGVAYGVLPSRM
ncbi:MAG: hypothetical protein WCG47_33260 [Dermatophilaceae bacterium]